MRKKLTVLVASLLIFVMGFNSIAYAIETDIEHNPNEYEIEFNILSQWDSGYQAEIIITNLGEETSYE